MDWREIGYNPSFIVNQEPNRFGDKQEDYTQRARQIIQDTANKISMCKGKGGDLKALFFEIIADLSQKRNEIAKDHQTEDYQNFGKRRDAFYPGHVSDLWLAKPYEKYNKQLLKRLSFYLKEMDPSHKGHFKEKHTIKENYLGRTTELTIEVFDMAGLFAKGYGKGDYFPAEISIKVLADIKDHEWSEEKILDYRNRFKKFKTDSPQNYQNWRFTEIFIRMNQLFPSPANQGISPSVVLQAYPKEKAGILIGNMKSRIVHVILRTNVNQKMYRMTDYLTWMYENFAWLNEKNLNHHPIQRMQERSTCGLLHQDEFLIEDTLKEVSSLFEKAVSWDRNTQSLQDLKDLMKPYWFVNVHNMRDVRGLAAENEWLEQAIFLALDVKMTRKSEELVDLIALANPLFSDFCTEYDRVTDLNF